MFRKVSAVVLFVRDFETSLKFYEDTLGLTVVQREPIFAAFKMDDHDFAIQDLAVSANMVHLTVDDFVGDTGKVNRTLLCARVDNVDVVYNTLIAKGVTFTSAPFDQAWGIRVAYFRDPEGNLWEIAHPLS